jgi:O-antigen ligase
VSRSRTREIDLPARLLEIGLAATVLLAPLHFGAVSAGGRLALELGALALGLLWIARALVRGCELPPAILRIGIVGLLALAALQAAPLGPRLVAAVSPRWQAVQDAGRPGAEAHAAEARVLGVDPMSLDAAPALSVDPPATASALRTGAALAALFLVACTVAAVAGARGVALGLLVSASFQGLYGTLVLASGHDRIWHLPKQHYLDSATGTFVNRNHFACFLAMALACGAALVLRRARSRDPARAGSRWVERLGGDGSHLLLALLLVIGLCGLLVSFSRAGIALGLLAVGLTVLTAGRQRDRRSRLAAGALALVAAALPLLVIGGDRLVGRFAAAGDFLSVPGGRAAVWRDALSLVGDYPWTGTGFGTFAAVYPGYRSSEVRAHFAHAHNDLLQALTEGGAPAALLGLLLLVPLAGTIVRALGGDKGTLGVGFAAGLAAFLLHALVDFNSHIPANAATAAILAGTLVGLPWRNRA